MEIVIRGRTVLIDDEDYEKVAAIRWFISPQGYALTKIPAGKYKRKTISMHRYLLPDAQSDVIDHINRNKLDNRKENLRPCTHRENARNIATKTDATSKHRGVSWNKARAMWQVVVRVDGRLTWLGLYKLEKDAARIAEPYFQGIAP